MVLPPWPSGTGWSISSTSLHDILGRTWISNFLAREALSTIPATSPTWELPITYQKSSKEGWFVTTRIVWLHFVRMNDFIYLDKKGNPFPARVHGHVYNPLGLSAPSLSLLFPAQPSPAQLPAAPLPPHGRRSGPAMRKLRHGLQTHRVSQSNRLHPNLRITQNCYLFDTCNQFWILYH